MKKQISFAYFEVSNLLSFLMHACWQYCYRDAHLCYLGNELQHIARNLRGMNENGSNGGLSKWYNLRGAQRWMKFMVFLLNLRSIYFTLKYIFEVYIK